MSRDGISSFHGPVFKGKGRASHRATAKFTTLFFHMPQDDSCLTPKQPAAATERHSMHPRHPTPDSSRPIHLFARTFIHHHHSKTMMRKLGMKRSFHSVDLPSIASFEQDASSSSGEESSMPNHWTIKRRRAVSADSSFSPSGCWVDDNDENTVLQTRVDASSYSNVQLVSPATSSSLSSHVAVVTPMPTSNLPIDEAVSSSSTCIPSLRSRRCRRDKDTTTFPATAALERFMLQRRGSNLSILLDDQDDDDCPIAFKIGSTDLGDSCPSSSSSSTWLNFDREHELSSPRQVHDFPLEDDVSSRRSSVSVACSPPPMTKTTTTTTTSQHEPPTLSLRKKEVCSDSDVACCVAAPSMEFHPVKSFALQPRINVNQLTEALARL